MIGDKITINGVDYTSDIYGLDEFVYNIKRTDDAAIETGTSNILKLKGKAYKLILDTFFTDPCNSLDKKLDINFNDSICCVEYKFTASVNQVKICYEDCYAEVVLIEKTEDLEAYQCLKNHINFWKPTNYDKHAAAKGTAYRIITCNNGGFLHKALLILFKIYVKPTFNIIKIICDAIDFLVRGDPCEDLVDNLNDAENEVLGCKRYHTAFNLLDMFQYVSGKCKLKFESKTILEKFPYNCLAWFSASSTTGRLLTDCNGAGGLFDVLNDPKYTMLQIAHKLKDVFNAEYYIKDGVFYFEKKEFVRNTYNNLFDVGKEYESGRILTCTDIEFNDEKLCAYGRFEYSEDSIDTEGNNAINQYNDIVEWNNPPRPNQTKECNFSNDFAPASFGRDAWQDTFMKTCRRLIGNCNFDDALIMERGVAEKDKLIIIDKENPTYCFECKFNTAIKLKAKGLSDTYIYNYPMFFDQFAAHKELYNQFWKDKDPRNGNSELLKINSIKYKPKDFCKFAGLLIEIKLNCYVVFNGNKFYPEEISIERKTQTVEFRGLKGVC